MEGSKIEPTYAIIINTGSPAAPTADAVGAYLRQFLSDPQICPINPHIWEFILEHFIIPQRAPKSAEKYSRIWTDDGSPLDGHMKRLARKLKSACGDNFCGNVRYATSYSRPSIAEILSECANEGCETVTVLPLYPQSAFSTTRAVKRKVDEVIESMTNAPQVRFIDNYFDEPAYIEAIANSISQTDFDADTGDRLLFAFHSIPHSNIESGDTYPDQTRYSARHVAELLGLRDDCWRIGYQCRFDKSRKWLDPFTTEVLDDLAEARRLFVLAPNFSVDCLETLYDIQIDLKNSWQEKFPDKGQDSFRYISCLNDSDDHVKVIKSVLSNRGMRD